LQGSNAKVKKEKQVSSKPLSVSTSVTSSGKSIYENNCVACHGVSGKGSFPGMPDFTVQNGRLSKSDSDLLSNIINGFQSQGSLMPMPPRGGNNQLSDADLNAVLKYIKTSFSE
jgi:cytochrome c5